MRVKDRGLGLSSLCARSRHLWVEGEEVLLSVVARLRLDFQV